MARIRTIKPEFWVRDCDVWQFGPVLYVITEDDGYSKIGLASHPERRRSALQTGNPREICICAIYAADRRVCADIEKLVLREFADVRARGEWLSCPPDDVIRFIEASCEVIDG